MQVGLPENYPYKSPSIGFINRMYHPNVDESSGSVCLDVINQTWSPMYNLVNIFDVFLPQLLLYPNPADPLNTEAAQLLMKDKEKYEQRVREHVAQHATPSGAANVEERGKEDCSEASELSETSDLGLEGPESD